ncbi:DIP1984 family protein [Candidatus Albibeggiatoa sp. nov. NOAA]|uniref:DIP1984 family protein n=1 Tax=Candidatus Albibeggiatoa sp. nov. NOAA TaxID=3162724 RepID=UPI0032F2D81D|nr:DIP1984 family protein [Thiotrichaceae bacterium]
MKLAEALIERKAIKTKMEEIKRRIYATSKIQEGDEFTESPATLLQELDAEVTKLEQLVIRINKTNNVTVLENGMNMMEALTKRDMLRYKHYICTNLVDKATPTPDQYRFSQREIKILPNINIVEIRQLSDTIARDSRLLDMKIQEANWMTELL